MDYTISRIIFSGVEIISILFNKFKYNLGTKKKKSKYNQTNIQW